MSYFNVIWNFFSSVKLSVVLLLTLAATSVIGTLIPQNRNTEMDFHAYGDFLYRFFSVLDLFNMYHSWWFQLLLLLLCINIIICSMDRLSRTWKIIFVKTPNFHVSRFRQLSDNKTFISRKSPGSLVEHYEPIATKGFGYSRVEKMDKGYCIFAERYRWSRLGVYAVHLSILLLLLGALIGSYHGFEGYVEIAEGDAIDNIHIPNPNGTQPLGFKIRCDDFNVSYYSTGAPSEYRSTLTIIENGKSVMQKDIVVNDPLRYGGISLFQSSFGKLEPTNITLKITRKNTEKVYHQKAKYRQQADLPEEMGSLVIQGYKASYLFNGQNLGETFFGTFTPHNSSPQDLILPYRYPIFDRMRNGDFSVSVTDADFRYYTGLQVTRDPGVGVVYTGFIIMILGCYITFFITHQQICVEVSKHGDNSSVVIAGIANKNHFTMNKKVEKIYNQLKRLEQGDSPSNDP